MLGLLITTILTSAVDSVNPIAITQQFILQGLVKKPNHIWYFILPQGLTNLISGFLAYYGLLTVISEFYNILTERFKFFIVAIELILGIGFIVTVIYLIKKSENKEKDIRKIKSVSPTALALLGVIATISELTSALPYFAFLAILFNYKLAIPHLTFILILYNFIYILPQIILYFIYIKAQDKFDRIYTTIKTQMNKWAKILAPVVSGAVGILLIFHSLSALI